MSPTIETASGKEFNYLQPSQASIDIRDIAHALSHLCRYTGHCRAFYSVAQHSVIVSRIVEEQAPELALRALLHDAAEAYIGDVASPLKQLLQDYRYIEAVVEDAINEKFGFFGPQPAIIKHADMVALATEKRDLMPDTMVHWEIVNKFQPRERPISPLPSSLARNMFLERYYELTKPKVAVGFVEAA